MPLKVLYSANPDQFTEYRMAVNSGLNAHNIKADISQNIPPHEVDYIFYAPSSALQDFGPYKNCKAVMSLWAGVERVVSNKTLTQPLTRMVDPGMTLGMVNWVTGHCLRHLLGMDKMIHNPTREWDDRAPPLSSDTRVTVLGLGALGSACATALADLGFIVSGWSRSPKSIENVTCHTGADGLRQSLQTANMVVLLLPDTPSTHNILNNETISQLPKGAIILNPGRGPLINDDDLLSALQTGQISAATLDVFRTEPLPDNHPFWKFPNVTVTPHVASATRISTASQILIENIVRSETGLPLLHMVDRKRGY